MKIEDLGAEQDRQTKETGLRRPGESLKSSILEQGILRRPRAKSAWGDKVISNASLSAALSMRSVYCQQGRSDVRLFFVC